MDTKNIMTTSRRCKSNRIAELNSQANDLKVKGVVFNKSLTHAWFKYKHAGVWYIFNGNDSVDSTIAFLGINETYGPPITETAMRPMMTRELNILATSTSSTLGNCFAVSVLLSRAVKRLPWEDFLELCQTCKEDDLLEFL